jgi:hypothetical protein
MSAWLWIVIIAVVVVAALVVTVAVRQRRTAMLRQRFGPEYDRAVSAREDQRAAEAELRGRERERSRLDIRPLSDESRVRFAGEWRAVQERFVDEPAHAVAAADELVYQVMAERGYPMGDFAAQADLVSVDHPHVVENYRVAHGIHEQAQAQQASTDDLREALLRYRSLFEELLRQEGGEAPADQRDGAEAAAAEPEAGAAAAEPEAEAVAEPEVEAADEPAADERAADERAADAAAAQQRDERPSTTAPGGRDDAR